MSTNYYLVERIEILNSEDYNKVESSVILETKYHVCQLAGSWAPLFDCSHGHFDSWKALETLVVAEECHIEDEYGNVWDWEGFVEEVEEYSSLANKYNKELSVYQDTSGYHWCTTWFN